MERKMLAILIVVGLMLSIPAVKCFAAQDEATDAFACYVTPSFDYAVTIDTPALATGIDFGSLGASASQVATTTATIKNTGTAIADWEVMCGKAAGTVWSLRPRSYADDTVSADTATLRMILTPAATSIANVDEAVFTQEDMLEDTLQWYAIHNATYTGQATDVNGNQDDADNVSVNSVRQAYVRVKIPSSSSVTTPQRWTVNIRAVSSATFGD